MIQTAPEFQDAPLTVIKGAFGENWRLAFSSPNMFKLVDDGKNEMAPISLVFASMDEAKMAALTAEIMVVEWMERLIVERRR